MTKQAIKARPRKRNRYGSKKTPARSPPDPETEPIRQHTKDKTWWRGEDSNLRRLSQQIYSLPPLATREPLPEIKEIRALKSLPLEDLLVAPLSVSTSRLGASDLPPGVRMQCYGAGDGTRTRNLLITNQLLYQLSYASPNYITTQQNRRVVCLESNTYRTPVRALSSIF